MRVAQSENYPPGEEETDVAVPLEEVGGDTDLREMRTPVGQ